MAERVASVEATPLQSGRPARAWPLAAWPLAWLHRPPFWLAVLAFCLYLVPAVQVVRLNPDAVEYLDIGRRLVAGEGYRLGIKAYHFGETQVLHDGLAERSPLYPLLVAALLGLGADLPGVQVANALLAALCAALVWAIGTALFGPRTGTLAGLLAAASPVMLLRLLPPMTEALATALLLLATWLMIRGPAPRTSAFAAAGAALGLAYLTRPTAPILAGALILGAILAARDHRALVAPIGAALAGFALFAVPISLYSFATRGSLSYSGQTYLYSVYRGTDTRRGGFREAEALPTPLEFIGDNLGFVGAAIVERTTAYAHLIFLDRDWLLWLIPAWPLALLALARGRYPRSVWPVLLAAAANFFMYAFTWSTYQDRYQIVTLLLLLPFAVDGLARLGLDRLRFSQRHSLTGLHVAIIAVALAWSPTFVREYRGELTYGNESVPVRIDRGLRWTGPPRWVEDEDLSLILDWIDGHTEPRDALAHSQPWPLTLFTGRPATLLPTRLSEDRLRSFLVEYQVAYVCLDLRDRTRRDYQEDLESLAARGVQSVTVGSYRVFDTRPLWRQPSPAGP